MKIYTTIFGALLLILLTTITTWIVYQRSITPQTIYVTRTGFEEPSFAFQFLRIIGSTASQQADVGECFETVSHINEGDFESWSIAWSAIAQRLHAQADAAFEEGHAQSALELYLRASNYYRAAEFYLHGDLADPRILALSRTSCACFARATALSQPPIEPLVIPYENTTLPGYLYHCASAAPAPTIIVQTGFDGTQEELYGFAQAAMKRGYTVITFEGPGQGAVLREQNLPFRPDWENVITPIIDYVSKLPSVDPDAITVYGRSFGGYLAPRAAAFDHRIKGLIANGGIYDPLEGIVTNIMTFLPSKDALLDFIENNPEKFDTTITALMAKQPFMRWFVEHGMYAFGVETPHDFFLKYGAYSLKNYAEQITSATLICDAEDEIPALQGQAEELYAHIQAPKTFMLFTAVEGAGAHCQMGAELLSHQRILDWLDSVFEKI